MEHSIKVVARSIRVWIASGLIIVLWLPLLASVRLFDRNKSVMRTGLWFRRLGRALTRANSYWKLQIIGRDTLPEQRGYVVISNHQSMADIPLISNLKWEMKWVGKKELFETPFIGWLMKLSGDIALDRKDPRSGAKMLMKAMQYLKDNCPVMFFPEGTRTRDGNVGTFTDGAFYLAIKAGVPILPLAIEGSYHCLPKKSWIFGRPAEVKLKVFDPIETTGLTQKDASTLRDSIRQMIIDQINEWRGSAGNSPSAADMS
ncbi:MAG: lysophospholipid acyltransferase family protein [bacterium]